MPPTTTRRPSTLAASNALAARLPLGSAPSSSAGKTQSYGAASNASRPGTNGSDRYGASSPSRNQPARKPSKTGPARLAVKTANDTKEANWIVLGAVAMLGMFAAVAGGSKFNDSMEADKAAVQIEGSLAKVSEHQMQFRSELQRYATWSELEQRGIILPARQRVVQSNADRSHWFMRVRDTRTGVECDRIGELVADPSINVKPTCRSGAGPMEVSGS